MTNLLRDRDMPPSRRWETIKHTNPTAAQIDAIDSDTPWQEVEPKWWLEMMKVRRYLKAE